MYPVPEIVIEGVCMRLVGTLCVAIVMEGPDSEIVHVQPDSTSPVGRIMFCVVL